MSLESALEIAAQGLYNTSTDLAVVANNVANAATPGYSTEVTTQSALDAAGIGFGVATGPTVLYVNQAIQQDLFSQNSTVANLELTSSALSPVAATLGTVGGGNDIASLLGTLQNGFITLSNNPANVAQQSQLVSDAQLLANSINSLSDSYTTARQAAQTDLVAALGTLNTALTSIGTLSNAIAEAADAGLSTADLENERAADYNTVSNLLDVQFISESNGEVLVETPSGLTLPVTGTDPLTIGSATVSANSGSLPGVTLDGADITAQLLGGRIGADITLRDTTLPTYQAELDEFSEQLSNRFSDSGLDLFTLPNGTIPPDTPAIVNGSTIWQASYAGYAAEITVNPAVVAAPSKMRDGTATTIANGATISAMNTADLAGYEGLINNILNYAFGNYSVEGTAWTANTTNLGPQGDLTAPYDVPGGTSLADLASTVISSQGQDLATANSQLTSEQQLQTTLKTELSANSGVSIDNEMSQMLQLQNSYGANAKIITAMESLFTAILSMVP